MALSAREKEAHREEDLVLMLKEKYTKKVRHKKDRFEASKSVL